MLFYEFKQSVILVVESKGLGSQVLFLVAGLSTSCQVVPEPGGFTPRVQSIPS